MSDYDNYKEPATRNRGKRKEDPYSQKHVRIQEALIAKQSARKDVDKAKANKK